MNKKIMQKYFEKKKTQDAGITLIALVVTIIVLLILAGVSIATLSGQNGLIGRSKNAVNTNQKASVIDNIKQDILDKQLEKASTTGEIDITETDLKTILNKYFYGVADADITNSNTELTANEDNGGENVKVKISDIYSGTLSDENTTSGGTTITTTDGQTVTITAENAATYYGREVSNFSTDGGKYRIFYYDAAGDFGEAGTIYLKRDYDSEKTANLYSKISDTTYSPSSTTMIIMKALNPSWSVARGTISYSDSDVLYSEKSVMWLCDEENFKTAYADKITDKYKSYVNYVIGAPSAEMYAKSYTAVTHTERNFKIGATYRDDSEMLSYTSGSTNYYRSKGYIYTIELKAGNIANDNLPTNSDDYYTGTKSLDTTGFSQMYCDTSRRMVVVFSFSEWLELRLLCALWACGIGLRQRRRDWALSASFSQVWSPIDLN